MLEDFKRLMKSHPAVFNPIWSIVYPLLRRSDGQVHSAHSDNRAAFEAIYQDNYWGNEESRSGWGSTLEYTAPLRGALEKLTRKLGTQVMLDAPCGDFNWMQHVRLPDSCRYIGGDIVAPLIAELQAQYSGPGRQFQVIDIVKDELPQADLWLCRDVLFHLPLADVMETLQRFARSRISYLLTTTYDFEKANADVKPGGFRYLNLRKPPFSLPPPELRIADFVAPAPPRYLGLWSRDQVAGGAARQFVRSMTRSVEMTVVQEDALAESPSHPEEIKSVFDMRVGKYITIQGTARITPAGVISTGIAVAAIALAFGYLASSTRRRRY